MKFTLLTNAAPGTVIGKRITFVDNKLKTDVLGAYKLLEAETVDTDLAGLKKLVESAHANQHLTAGTMCGIASTRMAFEGNEAGIVAAAQRLRMKGVL